MSRLLFVLIIVVLGACHKSNSDKPVVLKSVGSAQVSGRFIILDATPSTGAIASWKWELDDTGVTYPPADSILWHPGHSFQNQPDRAVNVTVPRGGKYIFGLTVYDKNGNWDYSVVSLTIQ